MSNIILEVADGVIWNESQFIADIVQLARQGAFTIDLASEGPCLESIGLNNLLDKLNIDPSMVTIKTGNLIQSSQYKEIQDPNTIAELSFAKEKLREPIIPKTITKTFGLYVGRSNWLRLGLASYLWNNYLNKSDIRYHYDPLVDYHRANFGLENFLSRYPTQIDQVANFFKQLPMTPEKLEYPIMWYKGGFDLNEPYQNIFCEIVCETFFSGRCFFFTEKTLRAIIQKTPFLVQGPKWMLRNLKLLGFQTFDRWWDEGYDEDPADFKYQALQYNIDFIAQQSVDTLTQWYHEMQPVLDHNINVLKNLTKKQILNTDFYYE